ncbi:MAG: trypsin-like peptidase domain-containing protein [Thiomargarita sp.]|nr:trypsin-like peptidase domain-containing protein [Thiomargarita sp.]
MNDELKKFVQSELERITVKISTDSGFKGTGFFVTPDGYILTAWHCIQEAAPPNNLSDILIEYQDEEEFVAKLELDKSIKAKDIAVLKINYQIENCIPLGRVPKNPKGDEVISVGYPGSHRNKAGMGIYSGKIPRFVNHDLEIEGAIKGQGQSGGLLYHPATHRIIGVVKKIYGGEEEKETLLQDAGLAAKIDLLFSKWEEFSDIHDKIAKVWDERLAQFTAKTDASSTILTEPKIEVNPNVKAKRIGKVITIGNINDVKELKIG